MPNGEIRRVGNMSQHWSRALLDIEVAYDTDLEHARCGHQARSPTGSGAEDSTRARRAGGVGRRGSSARTASCSGSSSRRTPSAQWGVSRELRERIKAAFDEEGIEIPFPQQTIWHRSAEPAAR